MKIKITHTLGICPGKDIPFCFETENVFEAYEAVKALIVNEHTMFPDRERAFNDYFSIVAEIASGKTLSFENHMFRIDRINAE